MFAITVGKDPCSFSEGSLQDQRSQNPDKIQIMCRSCKRLSHVSINNSRSSSWLACIQAQVTLTSTHT